MRCLIDRIIIFLKKIISINIKSIASKAKWLMNSGNKFLKDISLQKLLKEAEKEMNYLDRQQK